MISAERFAEKLVDWVSTTTQLDPDEGELENVDDWRRNAQALFELEVASKFKSVTDRADAAEAKLRRYEGGSAAGMLDRT
jgi:hypothetical protein